MKIVSQHLTDAEVIEAVRDRKEREAAVCYLYRAYFDSLAHFIKTNSGSGQDAEDYFQEALVVFIELVQQGKFRGDSSIKTFLYAIMRNLWLNELKRRNRALHRETQYYENNEKEESSAQKGVWQNETKKQVLSLIEKLGENCKKILILFYYEELPMKDIFPLMGYETEQVARNMKYKCMKKLSELLDSNEAVKQSFKNLLVNG